MFGVELDAGEALTTPMMGADELLALLEEREVSRADIGRVLGLPSSRISEMYTGKRRLQLDEAKKLVEHYRIEERASPLSEPAARLLVLYGAEVLQAQIEPDDPRVAELAKVYRAFSQFAADPRVRENQAAAEGFLEGFRQAQDQAAAR